jgi:MinD superfamily P-loop ATPase
MCRFGAIHVDESCAAVDPIRCEGCGVCVEFCPEQAIEFLPRTCGEWYLSDTRFGTMVHAQLYPGEENSGKLVALLRTQARELAESEGASLILADGPPGIGCPVISALSGTSLAVMVTEPTPSGIHDLQRVVELCDHFKVTASVIINKYDLSETVAADIRSYCGTRGLPVLAELPHDPEFVDAMVRGAAITEYSQGPTAEKVSMAWQKVVKQAAELKAA